MELDFARAADRVQRRHESGKKQAQKELAMKKRLEQKKRQLEKKYQEQAEIIRREKILAVEEAAHQEAVKASVLYSKSLVHYSRDAEGDRMILPQSVLEELTGKHSGALMTFQITCKFSQETLITHGGVLEFTAEEGTAGLPRKIQRKLSLASLHPADSPRVRNLPIEVHIEYKRLPKGNFVRLEPLDPPKFNSLPDPRAHLQAVLSHDCTTLTEGDTIAISFGAETHFVRVIKLEPSSAVSIIDTELEVDIYIPGYVKDEDPKDNPIIPLKGGTSVESNIESGEWRFFKVILTSKQREEFIASKAFCRVFIQSQNYLLDGSDLQPFISLHDTPTLQQFARKFENSRKSNVIEISVSDVPTMSETSPLILGLFGDNATTLPPSSALVRFEVINSIPDEKMSEVSSTSTLDSQETRKEEKNTESAVGNYCANCKRFIPGNNFVMHETFCIRNNITCDVPGCEKILLKTQREFHCHCPVCKRLFSSLLEVEQHTRSFHIEKNCGTCGEFSGCLEELREHQRSSCPRRLIKCRFCEDIVFAGGDPDDIRDKFHWNLSKHESQCGSKTIECDICHCNIRLKELSFHVQMHNEAQQQLQTKYSEKYQIAAGLSATADSSGQTEIRESTGNSVEGNFQCPICSIEVSSMRKLNSHLDTKH